MNALLERLLGKATELTRAGRLQEATAAIQAALRGAALPPAPTPTPTLTPNLDAAVIIDVEAREVDAPAPRETRSPVDDHEHDHEHDRTGNAIDESPGDGDGEFLVARYADAHGQRDYKLYLPPGEYAQPMPLVVMLHGCTQNPDDFAAGTRMNQHAREQGFAVLYPAQPTSANPAGCWNWFKHNHQRRDAGEPALLAGMVHAVLAQHPIDPARVFVAGLSAGGAMAAILGDAYPELFAAIGVHSGLPTGAATDMTTAFSAMRIGSADAGGLPLRGMRAGARPAPAGPRVAPPTIVFHGDADTTVHPANGEQVVQACIAAAQVNGGVNGSVPAPVVEHMSNPGRNSIRRSYRNVAGTVLAEHWLLAGAGHAWSGGSAQGSYADERGPDASREMLRFFFAQPRR